MDMILLLKFFSAFVFVIALMLLFSWLLKRMGLSGPLVTSAAARRLKIVEFLPVDHRRRLVLVQCDDKEYLLLLGAGSETVVGLLKDQKNA